MYEFWYDPLKPKYFHCIHYDIYKNITEDVETRLGTSYYELNRPLSKGRNKKVNCIMKDELGLRIMNKFWGLRTKTYSYLVYQGVKIKTQKAQKNVS